MHMIGHAAHLQRGALKLAGGAADVSVKACTNIGVGEMRPALFGREYEVQINGG
jgi:hypothetical protein